MKATIEVANSEEAEQIRTAMSDPMVRAFVRIVGSLIPLPSDRARRRVIEFAADRLAEENEIRAER